MSHWFPRPEAETDIELLDPHRGLVRSGIELGAEGSRSLLFELLTSPTATEWRDKVGVLSPLDGSAKLSTRLLECGDWVFKTDTLQALPEIEAPRGQITRLTQQADRVPIWHPSKLFFLFRAEGLWWPTSVCPVLTTVRQLPSEEERLTAYRRILELGIDINLRHDIGLDLNPSNFATDSQRRHFYYIDDECYQHHTLIDLSEAVVARIFDEAEVSPGRWQEWGTHIRPLFERVCHDAADWLAVVDGMRSFGFDARKDAERRALILGFCEGHPLLDPKAYRRHRKKPLTCVFSDIHANLPALEAVLAAAEELKVDSYLFLGDVVGYGPSPSETIDRLAEIEGTLLIGNHDQSCGSGEPEEGANRVARELDQWTHDQLSQNERDWLLALDLEHGEDHWLAVHGAPQDPRRIYGYVYELTFADNLDHLDQEGKSVCFYGHTHVPFLHRKDPNGVHRRMYPSPVALFEPGHVLLINPGSVGQPRDGDPRAAFAIWDRAHDLVTFHRVDYPIEVTAREILSKKLPQDLIARLELGR